MIDLNHFTRIFILNQAGLAGQPKQDGCTDRQTGFNDPRQSKRDKIMPIQFIANLHSSQSCFFDRRDLL
jgi:hypothetical protein